jgi:hypothetical protein
MSGINLMPQFEAIMAQDIEEIDKLAQAFRFLITEHVAIAKREAELLRAMDDKEALVKEQIKANTMEYTLGVFAHCYYSATGRKLKDE